MPSARDSSELERGEVPEVAALGNELTSLFNTLGISQNAYAVRISMDKSIVSRYLRGKRVAPQDFIDRLVREVEARHATPVQPEVRSHLSQLRLDAIQVCDPAAYELESLRAEMERSQRKVKVLARHQEALHVLLDKKEAEARSLQGELEQLRQDWVADQVGGQRQETGERERLLLEIARLKTELDDTSTLREDAERRCREMDQRVRDLEEALARRSADGTGTRLPLAALQEQLVAHWAAGEHGAAGRELSEATLTRPVEELVELVSWLDARDDTRRRDRMVLDVAHTRTVDEIAEFGHRVEARAAANDTWSLRLVTGNDLLTAEICAVMTPQDIGFIHRLWAAHWNAADFMGRSSSTKFISALLNSKRNSDEKLQVLLLLTPDIKSIEPYMYESIGHGTREALEVAVRASATGRTDLTAVICSAFAAKLAKKLSGDELYFHFSWGVERWPEDDLRRLTNALLDSLPMDQVLLTLAALHHDRFGNSPDTDFFPPIYQQLEERDRLSELTALAREAARASRKDVSGEDMSDEGLPEWAKGLSESLERWNATHE